jgi:hypothetical protein
MCESVKAFLMLLLAAIAQATWRFRTEIDEHFQHRTASVPYRRCPDFLETQILSF